MCFTVVFIIATFLAGYVVHAQLCDTRLVTCPIPRPPHPSVLALDSPDCTQAQDPSDSLFFTKVTKPPRSSPLLGACLFTPRICIQTGGRHPSPSLVSAQHVKPCNSKIPGNLVPSRILKHCDWFHVPCGVANEMPWLDELR